MIIGSGLLAHSFAAFAQAEDVCIYAAGVSNSTCSDEREFERERSRLSSALDRFSGADAFVYFGTCSVGDAEVRTMPYVQHKLAMERLVEQHARYLLLRLPQVAGITSNPHTLLNFLHARIARSESFSVWRNAYRNIIDAQDVGLVGALLVHDPSVRRTTMNVAHPTSFSMPDIVAAMEHVVGKPAVYDVLDRGHHHEIDVSPMLRVLGNRDIGLDNDYLNRILRKYYESH